MKYGPNGPADLEPPNLWHFHTARVLSAGQTVGNNDEIIPLSFVYSDRRRHKFGTVGLIFHTLITFSNNEAIPQLFKIEVSHKISTACIMAFL